MAFRKKAIRLAAATVLVTTCASAALAESASLHAGADASGELLVAQQTYLDVMGNLEASGYTILETKRTLLGRVKIMARNNVHMREVVVSRATGEVKRDEIVEIFPLFGSGGGGQSARASSRLGISGGSNAGSATVGVSSSSDEKGSLSGSVSGGAGVSASGAAGGDGSVTGGVSGGISGGVSGGISGGVSGGLSGGLGLGN